MRKMISLLLSILMILSFSSLACADGENTLMLPAALQEIEEEAFANTDSVRTVVAPEGLETIGTKAFAYSGVTDIQLPSTIHRIEDDAFQGVGEGMTMAARNEYTYNWGVDHGYIADGITSISSGEAEEITGTSAVVEVNLSVAPFYAGSLYHWCIMYSAFPGFQDASGNPSYNYSFISSDTNARSNTTETVLVNDLFPNTTYYYRAVLYKSDPNTNQSYYIATENDAHVFVTQPSGVEIIPLGSEAQTVPTGSSVLFSVNLPVSGYYYLEGTNIDLYPSIKTAASARVNASSISTTTDSGMHMRSFFYSDAGTVYVSAGHNDYSGEATIACRSVDGIAANLTVGDQIGATAHTVLNDQAVPVGFTAQADGWYEIDIGEQGEIWYYRNGYWYYQTMFYGQYYTAGETVVYIIKYAQDKNCQLTYAGASYNDYFTYMGAQTDRQSYFNFYGNNDLYEDLTIPMNVGVGVTNGTLTVHNGAVLRNKSDIFIESGGALVIEQGATFAFLDDPTSSWHATVQIYDGTLAVNGNLQADERTAVSVYDDHLESALSKLSNVPDSIIEPHIYLASQDEFDYLWSTAGDVRKTYFVPQNTSIVLNESLPGCYSLVIEDGSSILVPSDADLSIAGLISVEGGDFTNNGTLDYSGTMRILSDQSVITNNGVIAFSGTVQKLWNAPFEGDAVIYNYGTIRNNGGTYESVTIVGNEME